MSAPVPSADADSLVARSRELRERAVAVRRAAAALTAAAADSCLRVATVKTAIAQSRAQWRAWHAGLAALRAFGTGAPPLRVCMECEAVCFTPAPAVGQWVQAPGWVRERLHDGHAPLRCTHGLCPRCAMLLDDELDAATPPEAEAPPQDDWLGVLMRTLQQLERAPAAPVPPTRFRPSFRARG
ncbi:hypothetical protein [Roseisolibacter sp. H3M3-2]|uniref:hypothetical protein n=1 Tax=Roseisolibacter sp. H3M3-2 TaxID=3031323 RepID=UPI0023DA99BF|nr:hypothetical protein [Roseisolibacter sp. H3M3-2]MDF1504414.1 hypothetical protein [Roseisolibacter sp. H3M3-2]